MLSKLDKFQTCPDCGAGKNYWSIKVRMWDSSHRVGKELNLTGDKNTTTLSKFSGVADFAQKLSLEGVIETCNKCKRMQIQNCFFCGNTRVTLVNVFEFEGEPRFLCAPCGNFAQKLSLEEQVAVEIGFKTKQLKQKFTRQELREVIQANKEEVDKLLFLKSV